MRELPEPPVIAGLLLAAGSALLGGALALVAQRQQQLLELTRTFAFTAAAGVVSFHLLPEVLTELGPLSLLWIAAGFLLPWLLEVGARTFGPHLARRGVSGMRVAAEVGFAALILHSLFEGLALLAALQGAQNSHLEVAIVAHHAPLTAAVALPFLDLLGVRAALLRVGLVALAGTCGVVAGHLVPGLASGADAAVVQRATAVVAGALLHVVADEIRHQRFTSARQRASDLLAGAAGLGLAGLGAAFDVRTFPGVLQFGRTCTALALAVAPALVAAIAAEAVVRRLRGAERLRAAAEGFFATGALLGWAVAGVRLALALLLAVWLWIAGGKPAQRHPGSHANQLAPRGPWLALLLILASSVAVLAPEGWFAALRPPALVVIAIVLALAAQASASGATLVACALVFRGLPPELAVPFLALGSLPLRGVPGSRALLVAAGGLAGAFAVAALLMRWGVLRTASAAAGAVFARAAEPVGTQLAAAPAAAACAALLLILGLGFAWRSGVRGWFAPLRHSDAHEHPARGHAAAELR